LRKGKSGLNLEKLNNEKIKNGDKREEAMDIKAIFGEFATALGADLFSMKCWRKFCLRVRKLNRRQRQATREIHRTLDLAGYSIWTMKSLLGTYSQVGGFRG